MALMELLYKHSVLRCPNEENGCRCRFVFNGKDKEDFFQHKAECRHGKRGFKRDMSSFETCYTENEAHTEHEPSTENEPNTDTATHQKQEGENGHINRVTRGGTSSPIKTGELSLPPSWVENMRHAQICDNIDRLEAENDMSEAGHGLMDVPRRPRCNSMTYTVAEHQDTDDSHLEQSRENFYGKNILQAKVTEEARALFRFRTQSF